MIQKPKIQYVGQFYVYGSEALALEPKPREKRMLPILRKPLEKLEQVELVHVDPVALIAICVALFMTVTMLLGIRQLQDDWAEYQEMSQRVETLTERNHTKKETLRSAYTLADIRAKASAMGMIPKADAQRMTVTVTPPAQEITPSWFEGIEWFVRGLFA